ncbi:MAG: GNAT family N-acetyltransferase [Bacteroidales bacterium]|nr:GNAT family N-acetyltransferase [Bacteroidales bacterium]
MSSIVSLLKSVKKHLPWAWNSIEWLNGRCVRLLYGHKIDSAINNALGNVDSQYAYKKLSKSHTEQLVKFIAQQPSGFDTFFKPHGFTAKDFERVLTNGTFSLIGVFDNDDIIGYCFIRFFINKSAFRGKIVDKEYQGRGIAKQMGLIMSKVALNAGFRVYATISKNNVASLKSAQYGSCVEVIKEMPDNYLYVEIKGTK